MADPLFIDRYLEGLEAPGAERRRREEEERRNQRRQRQEEEEVSGFLPTLVDVGRGVLGGAVDLAQDVGELATFGALPDFENPLDARTGIGRFAQAITEFMIPFFGIAGWLGRGARIAGKVRLPGLSRAKQLELVSQGKPLQAAGVEIARDTAAGAVSDFAVVDAQEQRLANLIENTPFGGAIAEFMAAKEGETAAEAKLKGALEGAVVGSMIGGFISVLGAMKASRNLRAAGRPPEEVVKPLEQVQETARKAVDDSDQELKNVLTDARDEVPVQADHPFRWHGETDGEGSRVYAAEFGGQSYRIVKKQRKGAKEKMWFEEGAELTDENVLGSTQKRAHQTLSQRQVEARRAERLKNATPEDIQFEESLGEARVAGAALRDDDEFRGLIKEFKEQLPEWSAVNPRNHPSELLEQLLLSRKSLNLLRMPGDEAAVVRVVERRFLEATKEFHETIPNTETIIKQQTHLGDIVNADNQALETMLRKDVQDSQRLMHRTLAYKTVLTSYAKEFRGVLDNIIEEASRGVVSNRSLGEFLNAVERMGTLQRTVKGMTAYQGRALQTGRIPFMTLDRLQDMIVEAGGQKRLLDTVKKLRATFDEGGTASTRDTLGALYKNIEGLEKSRTLDLLSEYWINAILSGGRTLSVNALGGALLTIYGPFEHLMGAALARDRSEIRIAMARFWGMSRQVQESFRAARRTFSRRDPVPDLFQGQRSTGRDTLRQERAWTSDTWQLDANSTGAKIINFIGSVINYPTSVLQGTDRFFKELTYRGTTWARVLDAELSKPNVSLEQAAEVATKKMDDLLIDGRAFSQDALYHRYRERANQPGALDSNGAPFADDAAKELWAEEQARIFHQSPEGRELAEFARLGHVDAEDVTLTRKLGEVPGLAENLTRDFQNFVVQHPTLRFFTPFIRTPYRIARYSTDRTFDPMMEGARWLLRQTFGDSPRLNSAHSRLAADLWGKGATSASRAQGLGRVATGVGAISFFITLAQRGILTGAGPDDKEQRRILEAAGWLPFSIKTDNGYVQYVRMDPFATLMGLVADVADFGRYSPAEDQPFLERNFAALLTAVAHNILDRTYMSGLRNLVDALNDPDVSMPNLLERYVASFVPTGPTQLATALAVLTPTDPLMRDVRSLWDAFRAKVPYMAEGVAPIRNFLGEPVRRMESLGAGTAQVLNMFVPIMYSSTSDKFIEGEIAVLQHAFQPPNSRAGGIDLRNFANAKGQTAFDRMMELRQEVTIGGRDLRRALRELMRSREYQRQSPHSTFELLSPRIVSINSVINRYHRQAVLQMRREYPDVQLALDARARLLREAQGF